MKDEDEVTAVSIFFILHPSSFSSLDPAAAVRIQETHG